MKMAGTPLGLDAGNFERSTGRNYQITVSTARTFRRGKKRKANVITYGNCKTI
jgi:hypothetical protein